MKTVVILLKGVLFEKEIEDDVFDNVMKETSNYTIKIYNCLEAEGWMSMNNYAYYEEHPILDLALPVIDSSSHFIGVYVYPIRKAMDIEGFLDLEGNYKIHKTDSWTSSDDGDRYKEASVWLLHNGKSINSKEEAIELVLLKENKLEK